jgi:FlaG/FlaF family flagellin (archaellin)
MILWIAVVIVLAGVLAYFSPKGITPGMPSPKTMPALWQGDS